MKSRLETCAHAFGEEANASPEVLFGALDTFLTQLAEVRAECDAARRRRDEEDRRAKHDQEVRCLTEFLTILCIILYSFYIFLICIIIGIVSDLMFSLIVKQIILENQKDYLD